MEVKVNYGNKETNRKIKQVKSNKKKYISKFLLSFFKTFLILLILAFFVSVGLFMGLVKGIIDNSPKISNSNISPLGFATTIYDSKGNIIDNLVMAGSNRKESTYEEFPKHLIDAFVAIEDSRYWKHNGVDTKSVIRAILGVLQNNSSYGGGSTITQQLIKNNIFNGGREKTFAKKLERKIQEQYLAIQLEKQMDKKTILTNYLNTINLGTNTLGVKVASKRYFNKDVSELTLSESSVIAGITQNPSKLNPITGKEANEEKRKIILQYMYEQGYITKEEQEIALLDNVYERIKDVDTVIKENKKVYTYFTDALIKDVMNTLIDELLYTETEAHNLLYSGGLSIYTTQDPTIQQIVDEEVNNPDNYSASKYGLEYRLSIKHSNEEIKHYSEETLLAYHKNILKDGHDGIYITIDEAKKDVEKYKSYLLKAGDEILGESFETIIQPQLSFVIIDQYTGEVKAISGGRGEKTASLSLNRASDTLRQPGSTFKIISAFAPAIDTKGNTLASVYYDAPFNVREKSINNWYKNYLGYSNIREGIIYSMNIVAVKTLLQTVSPELGFEYAKKFGINSLSSLDYTASLALGGLTNGVSNLELTSAFASIANSGIYTKPRFFTKILDHDGNVLIDNTKKTHRVIKDSTAFLLTSAMADSMKGNKKFSFENNVSATSTRSALSNMNAAGKSGTTSNNNDVWFVGYTPYYTAGVWGGYDKNQDLSSKNGGTRFHKDIWKKIMDRVHKNKENKAFEIPSNIETHEICRKSGKLAIPGLCDQDLRGNAIYTEYFAEGTAPTTVCDLHTNASICADSGYLATPLCTNLVDKALIILPPLEEGITDDTLASSNYTCPIHTSEINTNEDVAFTKPIISIDGRLRLVPPNQKPTSNIELVEEIN